VVGLVQEDVRFGVGFTQIPLCSINNPYSHPVVALFAGNDAHSLASIIPPSWYLPLPFAGSFRPLPSSCFMVRIQRRHGTRGMGASDIRMVYGV
jgi:hypothetical protein